MSTNEQEPPHQPDLAVHYLVVTTFPHRPPGHFHLFSLATWTLKLSALLAHHTPAAGG